jgi:hypothetical protein
LLVGLMLMGACIPAWAEDASASITLQDHRFSPDGLSVPAGRKIELHVINRGTGPAEFESSDLRREKVVPAGHQITVYVGPLRPGTYEFFDDFHPNTRGHLVAR